MKWILHLWAIAVIVCAIGLWGQLYLAVADSKTNPGPAWTMPSFWAWVASPTVAWVMANYCARKNPGPAVVLMIGSTISSLGGWWLLWCDAQCKYSPGGMNPFAPAPGILMSLTIYPAFHWALFLGFLLLCIPANRWTQHALERTV